jgi:DNA-binding IclR family transcriptional regulator
MLAFQPQHVVDAVVTDGLAALTAHTNTSAAGLRARLDDVRQAGYALEDEESEIGMRCIAAPVREAGGAVVAAVGVAGPVQRLSKKAIAVHVPSVIRTAEAISIRLGYRVRAYA